MEKRGIRGPVTKFLGRNIQVGPFLSTSIYSKSYLKYSGVNFVLTES